MTKNQELMDIVRRFIHTLENRSDAQELIDFYHPDIEQIEFPNTLTKNKTIRNLEGLKKAAEAGKKVLKSEKYEILNSYIFGSTVIIEALWTGVIAVPLGKLSPGDEMKAHFAQFYEFENGKIIRQRNYDCFEPFA